MKYNQKPTTFNRLANRPDATLNHEGELAFKLDPLTDLYIRAASTLVGEPKFYEGATDSDTALVDSARRALAVDPEFVLKLAVYLREKLYLRSAPVLLLVEYANTAAGRVPGAYKYVSRTIQRADELTEVVACQLARNAKHPRRSKLPMVLKKGLARAFEKFDEYQLAKYNRKGLVKLRDVLFLTHPRPSSPDRAGLYDRLAKDALATPVTWEVMRSTGEMTWSQVVRQVFYKDGHVNNYMALLRNLRNILQDPSTTPEDVELVCQMLVDEHAVLGSRQLPFRFLAAYREVSGICHPMASKVVASLEAAATMSTRNMPGLPGTTLIASDVSGSMQTPLSRNSSIQYWDVGIVLSMLAHRFCENSITGIFGDTFAPVNIDRSNGLLANIQKARSLVNSVGCSTNGYKIIEYLDEHRIEVDRIMVFTDCQMWDSRGPVPFGLFATRFLDYKRRHPGVKLYCFDLAGYGNVMIPQDNVCLVGGWSDRVFDFIQAYEKAGSSSVIDTIRAIRP